MLQLNHLIFQTNYKYICKKQAAISLNRQGPMFSFISNLSKRPNTYIQLKLLSFTKAKRYIWKQFTFFVRKQLLQLPYRRSPHIFSKLFNRLSVLTQIQVSCDFSNWMRILISQWHLPISGQRYQMVRVVLWAWHPAGPWPANASRHPRPDLRRPSWAVDEPIWYLVD